jgi:hypothetical protein
MDDHLKELIDKGEAAKRILSEKPLMDAFAAQSLAYLEEMKRCDRRDDLGRYRLIVALNTVDAVKRHLEAAVMSGDNARKQAESLRERTLVERVVRKF